VRYGIGYGDKIMEVKIENKEEPSKLDEELEAENKRKFVEEYNALIMKYGYDFLYKLQPPEIVKVNIVKNAGNNTK
jgi:hypothetical protein